MAALDLGHIHESCGAADKGAARESELWDRLEPAFVQGSCAIGDPPATLEQRTYGGMILETLELLEGTEPRIGVVETYHKADGDLVGLQVIEERAAIDIAGKRPADRMHNSAGLVLGCV